MRIIKIITSIIFITIFVGLLAGCSTEPPQNPNNICEIFNQYPKWYWEANDSYHNWGVPISVQLAIIRQESHFKAHAKPPRKKLFGFIPWFRPTSAYGYAQAVDGTWREYQERTKNHDADRDEFGDATDFVGWYSYRAHKYLHVPLDNAYDLYLIYHEGMGGYKRGSYRKNAKLMKIARKVQAHAYRYKIQLRSCKDEIPKASLWNLWLI